MKSSLRFALAAGCALAAAAFGAELAREFQFVDAASRLRAVLFRTVTVPGGATEIRRPPRETRPELTRLLAGSPNDAELLALRAKENEQSLDAAAAEADWKQYAANARDKAAAQLELADFYHRRVRPKDELEAILTAGKVPAAEGMAQTQWGAYNRALALATAQLLGDESTERIYQERIGRFPKGHDAYEQYFQFLAKRKRFSQMEQLVAAYSKQFPDDAVYPVTMRAGIELARGSAEKARAVYERSFRPLWPAELVRAYFGFIQQSNSTREFLAATHQDAAAHPLDFAPAGRLFYYYEQQGDRIMAQRSLAEFRGRKEAARSAWNAGELWAMGALFQRITAYEDALRAYYALFSLPGAAAGDQEEALVAIAGMLLEMPEAPIRFGAADLSMYRDIATMDQYPGAFNGILSLLLNTASPAAEYETENRAALAYFHRVRGSELVALVDKRFPTSKERAALHERLVNAYVSSGETDAVIRAARQYLADFPQAQGRTRVSLVLADAYARKHMVTDEFAAYDAVLKELAARTTSGAASSTADYTQVLDRYVARLVSLKRVKDALALYRNEIARNPHDAGLYERLAAFLDQNKLGAETEQLYQQAIKQFNDPAWWQKLARWYLREQRTADVERVSGEVAKIFSGLELEAYLKDLQSAGNLDTSLYLNVNLFAHQRFQDDLVFVRNLLSIYGRKTSDGGNPAAYEALLRRYWTFDTALRNRLFEFLSERGRLEVELAALRSMQPALAAGKWDEAAGANPAAAELVAEGEAWLARYEQAAPGLLALHHQYPADGVRARRASSVHRSLAAFDPKLLDNAVAVETDMVKAEPGNTEVMTYIGDVLADQERFGEARTWWLRLPAVEPGKPGGYLETATIFWDYFQYDEALRLLEEGRRKLANPALYAYEAGAIYEGKREFNRAVEEYIKGALASNPDATGRLLHLGSRSDFREEIERRTAQLVAGNNPTLAALNLRVRALEWKDRSRELESLLASLAGRTTSSEILARVGELAGEKDLPAVSRQITARRLELATDPVEKLQLRIALARFDESHGSVDAAARQFEAIYRENKTILGVVRETADFFWRNEKAQRAVDILLEAASASYPERAKSFTVEAAGWANQSGQYARAREIVAPLLKAEPFNRSYIALQADSWAREGNDKALREFYLAKLDELRGAGLSAAARADQTAALRAGLIPALTRLNDYPGALDQYIELINHTPADAGLVTEAATYAIAHQRQNQLVAYYDKTVAASPRDFRWPMVLARLQAQFENYEAAIEGFRKAIVVRPDRPDLLEAKAGLEERLLRLDDAAKTYAQLYDLSYRNPAWMVKVAEVRARLNQTDAAVEALRKGYFEGRAETAYDLDEVADRLDNWNLPEQALPFAAKAVNLNETDRRSLGIWARIMTRQRKAGQAMERALKQEDHGAGTLTTIAETVGLYYTPEEKAGFAALLEKTRTGMKVDDEARLLSSLAGTAGLADVQAAQLLRGSQRDNWEALAFSRLQPGEVARFWEATAARQKNENRAASLRQAAEAHRDAGEFAAELRVLGTLASEFSDFRGRYYELLYRRDPKRLVELAGTGNLTAANTALAGDNADLALAAIQNAGGGFGPLWSNYYTALGGYYFARVAPRTHDAFLAALGPSTVGEQLASAKSREDMMVGEGWFYLGGRFGGYLLAAAHPDDAETYLPADVEHSPARADAYVDLGDTYNAAKQPDKALTAYQHSLDLAPLRVGIQDRIAAILERQGDHAGALARWRAVFAFYQDAVSRNRVPERFYEDVPAMLTHLAEARLLDALKPEWESLLKGYVAGSGWYRLEDLTGPVVRAGAQSKLALLLMLAPICSDPVQFLEQRIDSKDFDDASRGRIWEQLLAHSSAKVGRLSGQPRNHALAEYRGFVLRHLGWLLDTRQSRAAEQALARMEDETRRSYGSDLTLLELRLAAQNGKLDAMLERLKRDSTSTLGLNQLLASAQAMRADGQQAAARSLLTFAYSRQLDQGDLSQSNFLGLAEIRLEENDTPGALTLLRRMCLVSGAPYQGFGPAGDLLARKGHKAEAVEFLSARVRSTPWDAAGIIALAEVAPDRGLDQARQMAAAKPVRYALRLNAARVLAANKAGADCGSAELNAIASGGPIPPEAANLRYAYEARLQAAAQAKAPADAIALLSAAVVVAPTSPQARVALIDALASARRPAALLMAARPFLQQAALNYRIEDSDAAREYYGARREEEDLSQRFTVAPDLKPERRAAIAKAIGDAFRDNDRLSAALLYYRIAGALAPPASAQPYVRLEAAVRAEQQRRSANAARRPVLAKELHFDVAVQPRIAPPGSAARPQGGVQ